MTNIVTTINNPTPLQWQGSYAQQRAEDIGLSNEENQIDEKRFLLEPSYDNKNNILINYVCPFEGAPILYRTDTSTMHKKVFRTRLKVPFTDTEGKTVKYLAEKKQPVTPYFGGIWRYFSELEEVPVLVITEGELKALAACKHGIPTVGIPGIHQGVRTVKNEQGKTVNAHFLPLLLEYIQTKKVQRIVLLHDADAVENTNRPERAVNFWAAVRNMHFACKNAGIALTYKIIQTQVQQKGVDDLLIAYPNERDNIRRALLEETGTNDWFLAYAIKGRVSLGKLWPVLGYASGDPSLPYEIHKGEEGEQVVVKRTRIRDFLFLNGFRKVYLSGNVPTLVRLKGKIVSEQTPHTIRDFVFNEFIPTLESPLPGSKALTPDDVYEALQKGSNVYFSKDTLETVQTLEWQEMPTAKDQAYFFYQNKFVEVTPDGINLTSYKHLPGHVWESQIMERNIAELPTDEQDLIAGQFCEFMRRISEHDGNESEVVSHQRFEALMSYVGYMLHAFKDPASAKTLVLLDQNTSDRAEGGSGKGLLLQGLSKMKNAVIIDGRNFSFDKTFAWQNVEPSTQIVAIDDVGQRFPYQRMFSLVTDGWTVEKKNQQSFFIPSDKSPKTIITSNHVLEGQGNSFERRLILFELSRYFVHHPPREVFGNNLFTEWDAGEWNRFDHWMLYCVRFYLGKGLITTEPISVRERQLSQQIPEDVLTFLESFVQAKTVGSFFTNSEIMQNYRVTNPVTKVLKR